MPYTFNMKYYNITLDYLLTFYESLFKIVQDNIERNAI